MLRSRELYIVQNELVWGLREDGRRRDRAERRGVHPGYVLAECGNCPVAVLGRCRERKKHREDVGGV